MLRTPAWILRLLIAFVVLIAVLISRASAQVKPATCAVHVFPVLGTLTKLPETAHGQGLVLMGGGTTVEAAFHWMHDTLIGEPAKRGGNLVILSAGNTDQSQSYATLAPFASVRTIGIEPCVPLPEVNALAPLLASADIVFFEGGDQANYVRWQGGDLIQAVQAVYDRGGIVGGTSAGLAVLGGIVYDSVAADKLLPDDALVQSADAARNPFESSISFTTGFLKFPYLADTITDTHFAKRDRFGRLAAFMARAMGDNLVTGPHVYGVAVDERSALVVDAHGMATLLSDPYTSGYRTRGAYILTGGPPQRLTVGEPLLYTVDVVHLIGSGTHYDLAKHESDIVPFQVTVDGSGTDIYSRTPY